MYHKKYRLNILNRLPHIKKVLRLKFHEFKTVIGRAANDSILWLDMSTVVFSYRSTEVLNLVL